jgi:cytoskeletal protein CcmA (bactofilin family)
MSLWGRKKPPPIRSLISEGTVVEGQLRFVEGLRIDGEVRGDVIAQDGPSMLVISEKARVQGKVRAHHIIINGEIRGPVHSEELLELQPKARVYGDVRYQTLEINPGAVVDGELKPLKATEKPTLKLAASNEG